MLVRLPPEGGARGGPSPEGSMRFCATGGCVLTQLPTAPKNLFSSTVESAEPFEDGHELRLRSMRSRPLLCGVIVLR